LKKSMRVAFQLLLLSSLLFVGHWAYVRLLEDPSFRVREIEIEGCEKIRPESIRSLITIEAMPNLFTVKLGEISKRVETHPWIDHLVMRKVFPNKIKVQVEERKPIAILQLEELYYLDARGEVFSPVRDGDQYNFPYLTGLTRQALDKDPEPSKDLLIEALELLSLAEKEKASPLDEVSEVHMSRTYGIDCYAKTTGLEIKMGRNAFGEKMRRLSIVWSDLRKRGLSVMSIDCSDLNRIVVKKTNRG
jgi:cell division protein FtsQ